MKQVLRITQRVSSTEMKAVDGVGRGVVLAGAADYNIGDSVLVVNGVIVQKVKQREPRVYEV